MPNARKPPPGYETIEPIVSALENELRDKVRESNDGKRNSESIWPVHQINWQRSRYIYDMYYTHQRISRKVYDYCLKNKIADASLIAKWKKPGYERLCSTYVINPANYKFGTTSICRVPMKDRSEEQKAAQDPTTGCLGCASGINAGARNIFGNKYGQNLAAVQMARLKRAEALAERRRQADVLRRRKAAEKERMERENEELAKKEPFGAVAIGGGGGGDGESETDDESGDEEEEEDYGPSPAAGVWAGSRKLEAESLDLVDESGGSGGGNEGGGEDERPAKKVRVEE